MTATRIVVRGSTLAITRRTTFRKAFLAPWDPRVEQAWLYSLAYAQHVTRVAVHHAVRVVTHHHLSVTLTEPNLGKFLHRFHHDTSCAINTLMARERYDCPRNVFDKRSSRAMRLLDAAAQASHLTYEYLNPVAAGLVARPEHMPGLTLDWGHWKAGGIWVKRPDFYFDESRPEQLWLELTPSPELMRAFGADLDALIHHMRRQSEDGIRAIRDARTRPPMGAQKLQRLHPWAEPKTLAEPGGRRVPSFKIGARGFLGRRLACQASTETSEWRKEHEVCRLTRLAGRPAVFPHGTYGMRVFHRVEVAEPLPNAIVAKPGPLLHEVIKAIEEARDVGAPLPDQRVAVIDEVRTAWRDEASEVVGADDLDFASAAAPSASASAPPAEERTVEKQTSAGDSDSSAPSDPEAERPRPDPEVRHRFHRDQDHGGAHPRRVIVHRDRRRGRPRKKRGRSDPPA